MSGTYLVAADNLSDLANIATARANLGLGDMAPQAASSIAVTGGVINGTSVGATTAASGNFTSISANSGATISGSSIIALEITASGPFGIDFTSSSTPTALRLTGTSGATAPQHIQWLYSGSAATIGVSWPYFVFSNGITAPSIGAGTPGTGAFTTLATTGAIVSQGDISASSFTSLDNGRYDALVNVTGLGREANCFNGQVTYNGSATMPGTQSSGYFQSVVTNISSDTSVWNVQSNIYENDFEGGSGSVSVAASIFKTGYNDTWSFLGQNSDSSGSNPGGYSTGGGLIGYEQDLQCNGPDSPLSAFDASIGGRVGIHMVLGSAPLPQPTWSAHASVTLRGCYNPLTTNGYVYICSVSGTTGAAEPAWPTIVAETVVDGTVTWVCATTVAAQYSRVIDVDLTNNTSAGVALFPHGGSFYNAIIDCSFAALTREYGSSPAAMRLAADMPIDWSGNQTLSGQNRRTTEYNSAAAAWQYQYSGAVLFSIFDAGGASVSGNFSASSVSVVDIAINNSVATPTSGVVAYSVHGSAGAVGFDTTAATLAGPALRLSAGQFVAWEASQYITSSYNSSAAAWQLRNGSTVEMNVSTEAGPSWFAGGVGVAGAGGPNWQSGAGVPSYLAPRGSMYSRTDGAIGSTLYVSQSAGTWHAVAGV